MTYPASYSTNDVVTAAGMNTYFTGEGGPWRTYTPTISQGDVTLGATVDSGLFCEHNRLVVVSVALTLTAVNDAAAGNRVFVSLPVPPVETELVVGPALFLSNQVITGEEYVAVTQGAQQVAFHYQGIGSGRDYYLGDGYSYAMAVGYTFSFTGFYEAAP